MNRLLEPMQARYTKLEMQLLFIQILKNTETTRYQETLAEVEEEKAKTKEAERYSGRMLFLQTKEDDVLKAMKFCGPEKQEKLLFRLDLAKTKQKLANKAIKKLTKLFSKG